MIEELSRLIIERGSEQELKIATAESCTGGMIASAITDIAGSSAVFDRGFVTYSNEAKTHMLGVSIDIIEIAGAVSEIVAREMVSGALDNSRADIAVAVTGVAGPGGGSEDKPVGLVFIAAKKRDGFANVSEIRFGEIGRGEIRERSVKIALEMILAQMG